MTDIINSQYHSYRGSTQPAQASPATDDPLDPATMKDHFLAVFFVLLESMRIRGDTVATESNEIKINAQSQNDLNDQNAAIKFSILPENAKETTIQRVQQKNQAYAAAREDIQNSLITTRQIAQVKMTQTSTNVNLLQQNASEDSGWLQTLNTIFQVINDVSPHK